MTATSKRSRRAKKGGQQSVRKSASAEIEELRLRLEEAEQALEAIRTGQAESLIVEGPSGPRIFSLEGADHSYRILVEAMNEGAVTLGEDGTILYCNGRFAEMLEVELEKVMGSAILRFVPEHFHDAFTALVREANGGDSRGEVELLNQRSEPVPAYLSMSVIHDEGRRRFCLVATDLRAHKRNEAIVASEKLARSVIEQAAEAIVVCDERGVVIRASAAAARLCGKNPLRRAFDEVFPLEMSAPAGDATNMRHWGESTVTQAVLRGAVACAAPATLTRADGGKSYVLITATALRGEANRMLGCVINLVDVSQSKRAEEALRESERSHRLLVQHLHAGVVVHAADTRIQFANERACSLLGLTSAQMMGKAVIDSAWFFTREDATHMPVEEYPVTRVLATQTPIQDLVLGINRPATHDYIWVLVNAFPEFNEAGQVQQVVVTFVDISERKQAEEAARAADQRKSEFLGVLSHELRNPLTPIRNSLHILERATPGGGQAHRAHSVINRQVNHLVRLVDDLLDVTRITRGKVRIQRTRLDLVDVVRRTVDDYRTVLENHEIEVELPLEPVWVEGDSTRLAQSLGNLLHNAAKFTPAHGKVSVSLTTHKRRAVLEIADTGTGIDHDTLTQLFEPFAQADRSLDRSRGGLGLGLALVKGMVNIHGGEVSAHSEGPGKGARFTINLPLDEGAPVESDTAISATTTLPGRRILIIEDNKDAADSLKEALELDGHQVVVTYDGPTGIAKAREMHPDVVLCDIGLPSGMDGYAVASRLSQDAAAGSVCLVALTGYAQPEDQQRAVAAGFSVHLAKPPDLAVLRRLLSQEPICGNA